MLKRIALLSMILMGCATVGEKKEIRPSTSAKPSTETYTDRIISVKVDAIPIKDPNSPVWLGAPLTTLNITPQNIITPKQGKGTIKQIKVRSIYTDSELGILITWKDETKDVYDYSDHFCDKVAVQFPLDNKNLPSFMMGNMGGRVHIVEWKAVWQEDVERGYVDINDIYPNYWTDVYWYVNSGEDSVRLEPPRIEEFKDPEAFKFIPAYAARNSDMKIERSWPVMEYSAEGFGTLTPQHRQDAKGWGIYENGEWKVVIVVPRSASDAYNAQIYDKTSVAFAVWDGSNKDRGSRKGYTMWIPLELRK